MISRSPELRPILLPAPRLAATAWLLSPLCSIGPEGDAELRQSLVRRLSAVMMSAVLGLFLATLAAVTHPEPALVGWLAFEGAVAAVRIPLIVGLMQFAGHAKDGQMVPSWHVDLFVAVGTLWSASLGIGGLLCLRTGDPGLALLIAFQAMGTIGAQGVRSPGTPRLNSVQMCLVVVPIMLGLWFTTIPLAPWTVVLGLPYLFGMISVTKQLHEDYVRMIVARIDNRHRALHCPLTELPNRAYFNEVLTAALAAAEITGRPVTAMYLDLDGFKRVNDERGHAVGDALLKQVAGRLRTWKRAETVVARLGGDEFAALLRNGVDAEGAARAAIEALSRPYDLGSDGTATVGVSVGIARSTGAADAEAVLSRADWALYAAKRAGKGTFRSYEAAGDPAADNGTLRDMARRMRAVDAPKAEAV